MATDGPGQIEAAKVDDASAAASAQRAGEPADAGLGAAALGPMARAGRCGASAAAASGGHTPSTELLRRRPSVVFALQRTAGNRAISRYLARAAAAGRTRRAIASPARPAVQRQGGGGAKQLTWRGVTVSADKAALRPQLEQLVEKGGLGELRTWVSSFLSLDTAQKKAIAIGLQMTDADMAAIDTAVSETNLKLEEDARTFVDGLKPKATTIVTGILDTSRDRIEKELEHYGIKEIPKDTGGGGAEGASAAGPEMQIAMENTTAAQGAQQRARTLAEARKAADKAGLAFTALAARSHPDLPELQKWLPPELQNAEYKDAEQLWKMTEDLYAKQALAATQEFPVLAIYASGDDAASKLSAFSSQPVESLGETIWREAKTRLENIETVRGDLGGRFNPLLNAKIRDLTLGQEGTTAWQKRVGADYISEVKSKAEDDKMFWATIAIGLGLIAAIPTGGSSVAAGIGTAAAVAGAALSVYNAYEHWAEYQVQSASAKTDFAKAQSISQEEPSYLWLAIEIIGAGLEVAGAAIAFKSLVTTIKEAKRTRDVLKMAEAIESAAPPASRSAITARAAGEVGPEAVAEMIVAEGTKFRSGDLGKIKASLEQSALEGWTEAYDAMAGQGKIRPLTEEALHAELARIPAKEPHRFRNMAEQYIYDYDVMKNQGIYSPETGIIFVKPGGQHTVANVVAHEMVHAGQARMGQQLNGFWAEFEAMSAQKRLIKALDRAGVGGQIGPEVAFLRTASDAELANFIHVNYGYPIPTNITGGVFGAGDEQITRAAMEAAQRILAVGSL